MKHLHSLIIAGTLILAGSSARASEVQRHFVDFGVNLGWASTAAELHGDIPVVTSSITRAIAHFDAAEAMIGPPYAGTRRYLQTRVLRKLRNYAAATRGKSRAHKASYLRDIWNAYHQSLRVIYRTQAGRPQLIARSTCDSFMALAGYELGRAQIFAGDPRLRGRRSTAIQGMKRAISNGLRVSMDGYPSRSRREDKLCCSFGSSSSWHSLLNFRVTTPVAQYDRHRARMQQVALDARVSCTGGGNPSQIADARGRRRQPPVGPRPGGNQPREGGDAPQPGSDRPAQGSLPTASFKTSFGTMTFNGRSSGRIATYTSDHGRILGTAHGTRVSGHWVEKGSARRCQTAKDGSFYWGRADFQISGDKLSGKWGYCNDAPTRSWTGTRIRTVIKR